MVGDPAMVLATGTNAVPVGGTSFAVPQLAGWAACLWQATGKNTPVYRIRNAINQSGHLAATPTFHAGNGVPDFKKALELLNVDDTPAIPTADKWIIISPNPASSAINLKIYHIKTGNITYRITDISGRDVAINTVKKLAGIQILPIDITSLRSGMYFVTVTSGDKLGVSRFIKN